MIDLPSAKKIAFVAGGTSAALQIIHMSLENLGSHWGERTTVTLVFMGMTFVLWGAAAVRFRLQGGSISGALFAAVFSAMITMVVVVTYGIYLSLAGYPDAAYVKTWPEFVQSGWTDARAFAIMNSFEAAGSHFLGGPILGTVVGGIGLLLAWVLQKFASPKEPGAAA